MTDVVFDEVLRIARRCGRVLLAGFGEPLTNPQCMPMLRALDAEGIEIGMSTNGVALTCGTAAQLVELEHLTHINVSIDSPDPSVYREVRGASVQPAFVGLRNLMAVIDNADRVTVSSVAMRDNLESLAMFPPLLAELGVRQLNLQAVTDYNEYSRDQRLLDHGDLAGPLHEVESACAAHDIRLELSIPSRMRADVDDAPLAREQFYGLGKWNESLTRQCAVPWDIPFIDKDGRVFACCFAASANERQLGRLGDQTFEEVWTGTALREFRHDLIDGKSTPDICRRCTIAPLGEHPFKAWAASVVAVNVSVPRRSTATVSVSVRNVGNRAWTAADYVRVGTASPRNADSELVHSVWLSPNRSATFAEATVPSGGIATFVFPINVPWGVTTADFAIVADGTCWLPNTRFAIAVAGTRRRRSLLRPLMRSLQGRDGYLARQCRRVIPDVLRRRLAVFAR